MTNLSVAQPSPSRKPIPCKYHGTETACPTCGLDQWCAGLVGHSEMACAHPDWPTTRQLYGPEAELGRAQRTV
ncbi:MAG: hypothetical protein Q7K03_04250 [Dehalococcoidia bacterium]|nr:hypothetical protein [Dehalococcoidia bacterium]